MAYLGGTTVTNLYAFAGVKLPVTMRTAPTVTVYSRAGTASRVSDVQSVADQGANTGTPLWQSDSSFGVYNNSGANLTGTYGGVVFHYVASAEL